MHNHESNFRSALCPDDVLDSFREFVAAKGWQVTQEDETWVHARSGATVRGMGEDIEVSAAPDDTGSRVHIAVRSRMGVLQLVDWGEARIFHGEIAAWLRDREPREGRAGGR